MRERIYIDDMTHPPKDRFEQMEEIEEIKTELIRLKAQIHQNEFSDKKGLSRQVQEVEEIYERLKASFQKTTATSETALKDLKEGLHSAWIDLKTSLEKAAQRFDS